MFICENKLLGHQPIELPLILRNPSFPFRQTLNSFDSECMYLIYTIKQTKYF